jgi:hypothetical protein
MTHSFEKAHHFNASARSLQPKLLYAENPRIRLHRHNTFVTMLANSNGSVPLPSNCFVLFQTRGAMPALPQQITIGRDAATKPTPLTSPIF